MKHVAGFVKTISLFSIVLAISTGCGSGEKRSDIDKAIYEAVDAVVDNDVEKFMKFIDINYLDSEERTKQDIREKVETYLNRFRVIAINILNIKSVKKDNENADDFAEINFSHGFGKMLSKVIRSTGESYRFTLNMKRNDYGWVVINAEWNWMSIEELYPESIKVLRELFPDTF